MHVEYDMTQKQYLDESFEIWFKVLDQIYQGSKLQEDGEWEKRGKLYSWITKSAGTRQGYSYYPGKKVRFRFPLVNSSH